MTDNCPMCNGSGKQYDRVIVFSYDVIIITLDEYKYYKDNINNLIDKKCELMSISLKQRIKEGGEEYYKKCIEKLEYEI